MNRFQVKMVPVALAAFMVAAGALAQQATDQASAQITAHKRTKTRKQKKAYDLGANPLANVKSQQPDKQLYDKAMTAMKKGRYDVARLDLQTMLNTYPDSEYRMRAKLAVGDSWFKEGGSAALTQAEAEYKDFITFFPDAPEAAEAQMKVGDIYYSEMEKPDRDPTNAEHAEQEYRIMINQFPDSTLIPRAKQKLREVQEVLGERETQIGLYYESRENYPAALARLETVSDTYPLYSKSDQVLLAIGDAYEGEAHNVQIARGLPGAVRERLRAVYLDKASAAYDRVITRYPMAPHVEDARDRLVAMNRPVPEPTPEAVAESGAEEESRQPIRFTDRTLDLIKHGPMVVEAVHVGDPSLTDPKRTIAPDINKDNMSAYVTAANGGKPAPVLTPAHATAANEPPRSDQPSAAPLQGGASGAGTGVGVSVVSAPAVDPNAPVKAVGPSNTTLPAAESAAAAPTQVNDIKSTGPTSTPIQTASSKKKQKAPKTTDDESSSKKKKKKGLAKLNPF